MADSEIRDIHILGLSENFMTWSGNEYRGKFASLFNAFNANHCPVSTVYYPRLHGLRLLVNRTMAFRPSIERWRHADTMNPYAFKHRSVLVEDMIRATTVHYDLIFQLHSVFSPGTDLDNRRYVVTTDNTYTMSRRYWPDWAPVHSEREARQFIELETQVYNHARSVFVWAEHVRQELVNEYRIPQEKVVVIYPGNTLERSANYTPTDEKYSSKTALFVGYDFERKGGPIVLEAWKQVAKKFPDARLLIAGPSRRLAPPQAGVEWIGKIDRSQLYDLLQQVAVFVMPSLFEPFGMVYFEAMSMGVPCIATNRYGIVDCIQTGENGILVPFKQVEPVAEALIRLFDDPDFNARLGHNAYHTVHQNYTWKHVIDRMRPHLIAAMS